MNHVHKFSIPVLMIVLFLFTAIEIHHASAAEKPVKDSPKSRRDTPKDKPDLPERMTLPLKLTTNKSGLLEVIEAVHRATAIVRGFEFSLGQDGKLLQKREQLGKVQDLAVSDFWALMEKRFEVKSISDKWGVSFQSVTVSSYKQNPLDLKTKGFSFKGTHEEFRDKLFATFSKASLGILIGNSGIDPKKTIEIRHPDTVTLRSVLNLYSLHAGVRWRALVERIPDPGPDGQKLKKGDPTTRAFLSFTRDNLHRSDGRTSTKTDKEEKKP